MTVSTTNISNTATGDGASTAFNFTFTVQQASDVKVYLAGILQTTGYAVAINANGVGGTVTFTPAPGNAVAILIQRIVPLTQTTHLSPDSVLSEAILENAYDKDMMAIQQISSNASAALALATTAAALAATAVQSVGQGTNVTITGTATNPIVNSSGGGGGGGGGVPGNTLAAHNFANAIDNTGIISGAQPSSSDLSDVANLVTKTTGTGFQSVANKPEFYPNYRNKTNRVLGKVANAYCDIICVGDSTTIANAIPNTVPPNPISVNCDGGFPKRLIQAMNSYGIPAVEGWNTFDNHGGSDPRLTLNAGWSILGVYGPGPTGNGFGTFNSSTTNVLAFAPGYIFDTVKIIYVTQPGFGTFTTNVDGGASLGSTNCNAANGYAKTTFTGIPRGMHTLNIVPPGSAQIVIIAIECYDSTINSVRVSNLGCSGTKVVDWNTGNGAGALSCPSLLNLIGADGADLWINNLTINDAALSTVPATYQAQMNTLIANQRAASGGNADVIIGTGIPNGDATIYARQLILFNLIRNTIAPANNCAFFDLGSRWVSYTVSNPFGYYDADTIHGSWLGYYDFGWSIATMLIPQPVSTQFIVPGKTTIAGSAGNCYVTYPGQTAEDKRVVIKLVGYTTAGATVIKFPTAFANTPDMTFNNSGVTPTVTTSQISIPAVTTNTSTIIIEGI